ncbi:MAG: MMPL family transporter [Deltaproteobacteria bacterium]|nr:MMPL family transporter [Deltaproteobacteria bacterium]
MTTAAAPFATRWATWLVRRRRAITLASLVLAALAIRIAITLPVKADFAHLLPPSAPSVRDLDVIAQRVRATGAVYLVVRSEDPIARARVAHALRDRAAALPSNLVTAIVFDERELRRFAWDHRWLYASVDELRQARDALDRKLADARLRANPLYVDLDDDDAAPDDHAIDDLGARLRDAEARKDDPGELVSKDGRVQIIGLRAPTSSGESPTGRALIEAATTFAAEAHAAEPSVEVGVTGDLVVGAREHDSILAGVYLATALTSVLVLIALGLYYRSARTVAALSWSLAVATAVAFAIARATIGELNLATAFLSSIVVGNGINVGIVVAARWLEELAAGRRGADAIARTLAGTFAGTLAASLAAAVAYGSLIVTDFRGFRHFGVIGGVGMIACWLAAYSVLPAALALVESAVARRRHREPAFGRVLARLVPRRVAPALIVVGLATGAALVATQDWIARGPFETDLRRLRADNADLADTKRWMREVDLTAGKGFDGGVLIALAHREDAAPLVARLRAARARDGRPLFGRVRALDDLVPADQPARLALLAELRTQLDDPALATLDDEARARLLALRPPDDLLPLTDADLPAAIAWPFTETSGARGQLVIAAPGPGVDPWHADDLVRFSDDVRALELPRGAVIGGAAFVMADLLIAIERDGPRATLAALLGAVLVVALVLGFRRAGLITLFAGASGTLLMLGGAAALGLHVNFLNFAALPITIGIGIDYAANLAARAGAEGDARRAVATTGGAVVLCSYTTIVGYGALLVSDSGAIRSFGQAAILGEITCLTTALLLVPLLAARTNRAALQPAAR